MKTNNDCLEQAFNSMPFEFSSRQFSKAAVNYGFNKHLTRSGALSVFLHRVALQTTSTRQWVKKVSTYGISDISIDKAIALLKSNGYKIMKPVMNYEEI